MFFVSKINAASLVYIDRLSRRFKEKFNSARIQFADRPLNMARVAAECDLVILHGTHGSAAQVLLAGKPALHLPLYLEQYLTARLIEQLKAGLKAASLKPADIAAKLESLLASESYSEAARKFATGYADAYSEQNLKLAACLDKMIR
jgi:UDP:flavonoid glycosyltransferase YjiC (YdhE family)